MNPIITALKRENNTRLGNPQYTVFLEMPDGEKWQFKTQANAGWVYAITDAWVGKRAEVTVKQYRRYIRIIDMKVVQA